MTPKEVEFPFSRFSIKKKSGTMNLQLSLYSDETVASDWLLTIEVLNFDLYSPTNSKWSLTLIRSRFYLLNIGGNDNVL